MTGRDSAISAFTAGILLLVLATGCSRSRQPMPSPPGPGLLPQTIRQIGSTTMLPLAEKWRAGFNAEHPEISIAVSGGGSGTGIKALISGTAEIANSSREVQPAEVAQARGAGVILLAQAVAKDGVAVIVNPANPVRGFTLRMLSDIYVGKVRDWGQAGAPGLGAIQLVSRDSASGTYEFFRDAVVTLKGADKSRDYAPEALKQTSNQAVLALVGQTRSAIGYVGLGYLNDSVRAVGIIPEAGGEAVMPTAVTVLDGSYPLARDLYCVTNGEPAGPVRTYLEWIMGPKGQQIVKEAGFVSLIQP